MKNETKNEEKEIKVGGIAVETFSLSLKGTSPLLSHKFSERAQTKILDKQMKTAGRAVGREAKNPEQDYLDSLYVMEDGRYGFPISAFKNSAVDACSFMEGLTKVMARGAFHLIDENGSGLTAIDGTPKMRKDVVRLGGPGSPADIRYRGEFPTGWKVKLLIRYNKNAISIDQIVQVFNCAGFGIGVGDWRPQKDGSYGMFEVVSNGKQI